MLILSSSAATSATPASRRISSVGPPGGRSAAVYASHSRNMKFPADGRILSVASSLRSKLLRPIVCVEKVMATGETVEDTGSIALVPVKNFLTPSRDDESTNGAGSEKPESTGHSRTFLEAKTEKELLLGIRKELESGNLSPNVASLMEELYYNYRNAVLQSGIPRAYETILSNMAVQFDRILVDVEEPYAFPPYHMAIREPFDYYTFGQNYIRPLLDFRTSYIGNLSIFADVENKVRQGHNVVLISNHQTEADPAVISILLEKTNPFVSENMTYVAGDRVLTDPLCKPFSMGRNLICVYSKKHMNDIPELVEMKKKANTKSLKEMVLLLRSGGQLIWIAPSGGRDRQDSLTGDWYPAPFDPSSVDNIRRLAEYSGVPSHIYPLAVLCHDIMPPPPQVEKQIGERRLIGFHGAGVSLGPEAKLEEVSSNYGNPEESKGAFSQALYASVTDQYRVLHSAIHGSEGLDASKPDVLLSQPRWQ